LKKKEQDVLFVIGNDSLSFFTNTWVAKNEAWPDSLSGADILLTEREFRKLSGMLPGMDSIKNMDAELIALTIYAKEIVYKTKRIDLANTMGTSAHFYDVQKDSFESITIDRSPLGALHQERSEHIYCSTRQTLTKMFGCRSYITILYKDRYRGVYQGRNY